MISKVLLHVKMSKHIDFSNCNQNINDILKESYTTKQIVNNKKCSDGRMQYNVVNINK